MLKLLKITRKKTNLYSVDMNTESTKNIRIKKLNEIIGYKILEKEFIYLDEASFISGIDPTYGYSKIN